jgi:preprotein translocase subunit SecE
VGLVTCNRALFHKLWPTGHQIRDQIIIIIIIIISIIIIINVIGHLENWD